MRKNTKKGAAQVKFDTTAHDYGKRAVTMTPSERTNYREGLKHAVSFAPVGGGVGLIAKIASKILTKVPKIAKAVKATTRYTSHTRPTKVSERLPKPKNQGKLTYFSVNASSIVPKNPRLAAKAKGDMSYLSIAKADKSAASVNAKPLSTNKAWWGDAKLPK